MLIKFKIFEDSNGRYLNYVPECEGGAYGFFVEPNPNTPPTLFPMDIDYNELCEESIIEIENELQISHRIIEIETIVAVPLNFSERVEVIEEPQIIHLSSFTTKNDFEGEGDFDDFEKIL